MTNLAIECSGTAGSVAIYDAEQQLSCVELDSSFGSVQTLAPQIQRLVRQFGTPTLISVTQGPGSFTGLRVGLTTAKMLALAWKLPIVTVDTLEAVALRAVRYSPVMPPQTIFIPVINAFRKQVFSAAIQFTPNLTLLAASQVLDAADWLASPLQALVRDSAAHFAHASNQNSLVLCGPGLSTYSVPEVESRGIQVAPQSIWSPTAAEVAWLGWQKYQAGITEDAFSLQPLYLRASAAEEQAGH